MLYDLAKIFVISLKDTINELYLNYSFMSEQKALEILDLNRNELTNNILENNFQRIYKMNDVENGDSPYLQKIVKNAYEYLKKIIEYNI